VFDITLTEELAYSIMIIVLFWIFHPLGKYFVQLSKAAFASGTSLPRPQAAAFAFSRISVMALGVGYFALFYLLLTTAMTKSEFIYFQF